MAIVSTAEYKVWRNISASTYDAIIAVMVAAAQTEAERWCNRTFDVNTFTESYDGKASEILVLRSPPITSIAYLRITQPDGSYTTVDDDTYNFDAESGVVKYEPALAGRLLRDDWGEIEASGWGASPMFPDGFRNIEAKYVGGYGGTYTMPADLKFAMYRYLDEIWNRSPFTGTVPGATQSIRLGDYAETFNNQNEVVTIDTRVVSLEFAKFARLFQPWRREL